MAESVMLSDRAATEVLVIGAGVIGLACAYQLARSGRTVRVIDPAERAGVGVLPNWAATSWAAAGMLAPLTEATFGEADLTELCARAVPHLETFAELLQADTGVEVGLRRDGAIAVAFNADDRAALDRLTVFRASLGRSSQPLSRAELRSKEPYLATEISAGVLAREDYSVDNRKYLTALYAGCVQHGVSFSAGRVTTLTSHGVLTEAGEQFSADTVVLANGASAATLSGLPVRPVKGQILRLAIPTRLATAGVRINHTVRGLVRGSEIYLVPREDGELVIGATSEDQGFDTTVTAGGVYELLRNAYEVAPIISEFSFVEACAGSRPATPDNAPILGYLDISGRDEHSTVVATGHNRNGILLSAITAQAVVGLLAVEPSTAEAVLADWKLFAPGRFER